MPEPTPTPHAVFLSYAREDSESVRRIADALRAFGVEVWFDQNELRGGDAWDQKIRTQIRTCMLCVPVISAATQSRGEGYFRREWKFAVERTHDMAAGLPFLLPVVIDDTAESEALVPDEFMRVQWTRLAHGVPTPEFVGQVKRLLDTPPKPARDAGRSRPPVAGVADPGRFSTAPASAKRRPGWMWGVLAVVIAGGAVALVVSRKSGSAPSPAKEAAVAVAPIAAAATAPAAVPVPAQEVNDKSVAVLPFENMSEDKDNAFFADGIQEDILTNLALVKELHVVSRTSVMQYRGTTKPIREIGKELGVAYVLEGSVQREGKKVRVTGQLINARTDEHVWAKAYDRDITDIFAIQSELSQAIASALSAALSPQEKQLLDRRPTKNLIAYDDYLQARQLALNTSTESPDFPLIESMLKKAVALDPNFAAAWGELARACAYAYFNETDRSAERLAEAKVAIETAVRLAPDDPDVIEAYGDYYYYGYRDYTHAGEQYQRLAVLRPNDAGVFGSLGLIHRRQGRFREGLAELQRAVEIEPRNLRYLNALQQMYFGLGRYDEATALQQRVVDLSPGDLVAQATLVQIPFFAHGSTKECNNWIAQTKPDAAHEAQMRFIRKQWATQIGDWDEATRLDGVQRYYENYGFPHWGQDLAMAFVLAAHGDRAAARARAEQTLPAIKAELESKPSAGAWGALSGVYILTGDRDEALRCARKAMELVPEADDAVAGPNFSVGYASCLAWLGDKDASLAKLARLLRTPFGENVYDAKYGLNWFPLRGDPRLEALVNDPKNNDPVGP